MGTRPMITGITRTCSGNLTATRSDRESCRGIRPEYAEQPARVAASKPRRSWVTGMILSALAAAAPGGFAQLPAEVSPAPAKTAPPTLFIIGDSTVRNGNGTGQGGQWGWGDFIAPYFDPDKIRIVNAALGGTSSRTFYRDRWPGVKAGIKAGDFLLLQFGHNDASPVNETEAGPSARSRGTLPGIGSETRSITNVLTGRFEVVHTFGWYEEQFIRETRALGATPIVCSLIPRNRWSGEQVVRDSETYAGWAGDVAARLEAPFLDLNGIIAGHYEALGKEKVDPLFVPGAGPHTSRAGAQTNALCVVNALGVLKINPLEDYLSGKGKAVIPASMGLPKQDERIDP